MSANDAYFAVTPAEPQYILHGFWSADLGLAIWLEQVQGHKIVVPGMLPDHAFPPFIMEFLRGLRNPRKYRVTLLTTKGRRVQLDMPVYALAPEQAAEFLYGVAIMQGLTAAYAPEPGDCTFWQAARIFQEEAAQQQPERYASVVEATIEQGATPAGSPLGHPQSIAEQLAQGEAVAIDDAADQITLPPIPWGIGRDLQWLAQFRLGLGVFVRAGNLGITLKQLDHEWHPQWKLNMDVAGSMWISKMLQAAPGVIPANFSGDLADSLLTELTPWVVHSFLTPLRSEVRPQGWQSFVRALLEGKPYRYANARMLHNLGAWNNSAQVADVSLVLKLECVSDTYAEFDAPNSELSDSSLPPVAFESGAVGSGAVGSGKVASISAHESTERESSDAVTAATSTTEASTLEAAEGEAAPRSSKAVWVARVQLQTEMFGSQPIRLQELSGSVRLQVQSKYETLLHKAPLLETDRLVPADSYLLEPEAQFVIGLDRRGADAGQWDAYLTTDEVVYLLEAGKDKLAAAGIRVLVPSDWATGAVRATMHAETLRTRDAVLGFDTILDFSWEVAIGDTPISAAEMQELLASCTNLVRFRDQWIYADQAALRYYRDAIAAFEKDAQDNLDTRVQELQALREQLRDNPAAQEYLAQQERELADAAAEGRSQANLGFLRAMSLEYGQDVDIEIPGWQQSLVGGSVERDPSDIALHMPDTLHAELRDYQYKGVQWLYWMGQRNIGAILADDMGLGKTLQIIALELYERTEAAAQGKPVLPTLVVCPTSLLVNWKNEIEKFAPSVTTVIHHGAQRASGAALREHWEDVDIIITSYGMVLSDFVEFHTHMFRRLVVDEAQKMKNPRTKVSRVINQIPSQHRVALSGTPVENNLLELHALMDFCNTGSLGSRKFFTANFAVPIERYEDKQRLEQLRKFSEPFILRRSKQDPEIRGELPDKQEIIIPISLTAEQAALYQAYNAAVIRKVEERSRPVPSIIFQSLTAYKQICNHPAHYLKDGSPLVRNGEHRSGKVAAATTLIEQALQQQKKVLIFTQFVEFARMLQQYFAAEFDTDVQLLYGGVSAKQRAAMVHTFQTDPSSSLMILTHGSGGVGLNLTAASVVIHMDRWWNPAVENQATDRAYRIGQDKEVTVYKMVTQGTIEERIDQLIAQKQELAAEVIAGGENWLSQLNHDELAELLSFHQDGSNHLGELRKEQRDV